MELHREPEGRVKLSPLAVDERKWLFWRTYTDDVLAVSIGRVLQKFTCDEQANGRMRP